MVAREQADADETAHATPEERVSIDASNFDCSNSQVPAQELLTKPSQIKNRKATGGQLMSIPSYQSPYSGSRSYNYEERYAPDPLNDEIKENARVWKVYLDEADSYDDEMLRGFKDTIDSLLVFAALFSGVVTSFVITTVSSLQPDYAQITATLLVEQVNLLRAAGNVTEISAVSPAKFSLETVVAGNNNLWINGLFFASLSLSLTTALLSVLVKQWLQAYSSMSFGNARERALIRQFRFSGVQKWKLAEIIGILPLVLHTSLALFFIGLSLYVAELHSLLCWIVIAITALAFTVYLGSIFIPQIWLECPYRIPLLFVPTKFVLHPFSVAKWMYCQAFKKRPVAESFFYPGVDSKIPYPVFSNASLEDSESEYLSSGETADHVLADIIGWLCTLQSNQSIQRIIGQSLHGILKIDYDSLCIYQEVLDSHLHSISQTVWSALVNLDESDTYGYDIWRSVISLWMELAEMTRWPKFDVEIAKDSWIKSIRSNRKSAMKIIIEFAKTQRSARLPSLCNLFHEAAKLGHADAIEILVASGANINELEGEFGTALQGAAYHGNMDIVKLLVDKGAEVNIQGGRYGTTLQAAATGRLEIVKFLVEKGADVNIQGGAHGTALQAAAARGRLDIVKFLVKCGANVLLQGGYYGTALQAAAACGRLDIVEFLVENGADVHAQRGYYGTVPQAAAAAGSLKVVKFLVENGAGINVQGGEYGTVLQAAATSSLDIVKFLMERGADVSAHGGYYETALQASAATGRLEIARYLVEKGADVNAQGGAYGTALQAADEKQHHHIAKYLKDHGARQF